MEQKRSIFIYPITKESLNEQNNTYVKKLIGHLGQDYIIINGITGLGLVDALAKFTKTDIFYFNWIENLPTKRFGIFQVFILVLILLLCKVFNKKVVWFVHNNISHDKKYYQIKKVIVKLMARFADIIFAHSAEITLKVPKEKLHIFHHPIEQFQPLDSNLPFDYDLLIWGAVLPYKGVAEFVEYVSASQQLGNYKILIAGKFDSDDYYNRVVQAKSANITVINKFIPDGELINLFSQSRYILFTYASASILSSAALCKSLAYGKEVVAPNVGSFKELGQRDLVYTYASFTCLEVLLFELKKLKQRKVEREALISYIQNTSWNTFSKFLFRHINNLYNKSILNSH